MAESFEEAMARSLSRDLPPRRPWSVPDDRRCTAHNAKTGERCQQAALIGHTICYHHGGATPQVQKVVAQRRQEMAMERLAQRLKVEVPYDTSPERVMEDVLQLLQSQVEAAHRTDVSPEHRLETIKALSATAMGMVKAKIAVLGTEGARREVARLMAAEMSAFFDSVYSICARAVSAAATHGDATRALGEFRADWEAVTARLADRGRN